MLMRLTNSQEIKKRLLNGKIQKNLGIEKNDFKNQKKILSKSTNLFFKTKKKKIILYYQSITIIYLIKIYIILLLKIFS